MYQWLSGVFERFSSGPSVPQRLTAFLGVLLVVIWIGFGVVGQEWAKSGPRVGQGMLQFDFGLFWVFVETCYRVDTEFWIGDVTHFLEVF